MQGMRAVHFGMSTANTLDVRGTECQGLFFREDGGAGKMYRLPVVRRYMPGYCRLSGSRRREILLFRILITPGMMGSKIRRLYSAARFFRVQPYGYGADRR